MQGRIPGRCPAAVTFNAEFWQRSKVGVDSSDVDHLHWIALSTASFIIEIIYHLKIQVNVFLTGCYTGQ